VQGDDAVSPSRFERFSSEPLSPAHLALLAWCILNPNCADYLDDEGNQLVMSDVSKRQATLVHLHEANELIRCGTGLTVSHCQLTRPCPVDTAVGKPRHHLRTCV